MESSRVHSRLNELSILDKPIDADQFSGPVMKVPERKTKQQSTWVCPQWSICQMSYMQSAIDLSQRLRPPLRG